jgi:hypothetical protein
METRPFVQIVRRKYKLDVNFAPLVLNFSE